MTLTQTLFALICVIAISVGQLLFKKAGIVIQESGSWISWRALIVVVVAITIYGLTTLLWINLLRQVDLHKAQIFMALSFVLVPIGSYFFFREHITTGYLIGTTIVIIGLIIATKFG
ncbi:EamA family transporter [Aceticella autotrophica]|uniref:EamA family transporter n=1 Tax=Aceticella autotrophica TaxID=2755338 RepID=A0A975AWI2_9THEO|nr:EamA family transporter [Aceticella autotrophica]QSZ27769.1 EamA family transporter [Aceticella autotrophica]